MSDIALVQEPPQLNLREVGFVIDHSRNMRATEAAQEQGRKVTPSPGVVDSIARAQDLDSTGRDHLGHLIGATPARFPRIAPSVQRVRPGPRQLIEALQEQPAIILRRRMDILPSNRIARALFADFRAPKPRERNYAR